MQDNLNINIKNLTKQLFKFISSKDFTSLLYEFLIRDYDSVNIFTILIALYETKEKFLSFKIFFNLLEEIWNMNYYYHIEDLVSLKMKRKKEIEIIYNSYYNNNPRLEECEKYLKNYIKKFIKEKHNIIEELNTFFFDVLELLFKDKLYKLKEKDNNLLYNTFNNFNHLRNTLKKEKYFYIDNLIKINISLNYNNIYQNLLFILNLYNHKEEIELRDKIDKKFFQKYGDTFNFNDKLIWTLYKEDKFDYKSGKFDKKTILEGKKTEKEEFNFDIFDYNGIITIKKKIWNIYMEKFIRVYLIKSKS